MNEKINIIKDGCVTIQYGNGFQDGIKASVRSFRICRSWKINRKKQVFDNTVYIRILTRAVLSLKYGR